MGQAGSIEQRNAIRDVVTIKPASVAQDREAVVAALQAFCKMFPIEAAGSEAPLSNGEESGGNSGSLDVKESKLFFVMHALLQHATECTEKNSKEDLIGLTLTSIKRVILWRDLYRLGAKCSMKPFLNCLLLSPALARSALHVMLSLTGVCPGAESSEKTEKWETLNRRNFADSGGYDVLRSLLVEHGGGASKTVSTGDGDTVLTLVLEMFYSALVTRRHTSDISTTSLAVGALLNARIALLGYCHHTNSTVQEYAIDLVIELFFLIDLEQVHELQESAREYGALLYALSAVVSERKKHSISSDDGSSSGNTGDLTPTNSATTLQQKHLDLVEIFCAGNTRSKKVVSRIFPVELFIPLENRAELISRHTASSILKSTRNNRSLPSFTFDFELRSSVDNKRGRVGSLVGSGSKLSGGNGGAFDKWLQEARNQGEDWKKIVASLHDDHERPDLVWKSPMRNELRQALRAEIDKFEHLRDMAVVTNPGSTVRWEHDMFRVDYASMQKELVVNGYFVECLIPILADLSNQFEVVEPLVFAWHLTDRLAVEESELWRILCVRCLRLTVRRYAMVLQGQVPTRYILELLRHHSDHSQQFIRECFLLLNTAILTTRNAPSEILDNVSTSVAIAVVEVLSDSTLVSALSRSSQRGVEDDIDPAYDFDEERVIIRNGSDGLVRAGISVLQTIIRRSKYTLQLIRPKRVFICRLLAVETLDHVTVNRILTILKQFVHLDSTGGILANTKVLHTVAKPAVDANWKALALVYILVACCDPNGRGMSAVAAEFLKENYCDTSHHQSADESPTLGSVSSSTDKSHLRRKQKKSEFNELLNDALGFDGCGIGSLLRSSEPRLFCDIFNAEVKKSADVWWGRRQRVRLFRYLKRKFVASSSDLPSNNQSEEGDEVVFPADLTGEDPTRLQDGSDDEIFVGNIFLRSYVEGDGEFLNEWTPGMYKSLIQALFVRLSELSRAKSVFGVSNGQQSPLRARAQPWEVQVLILKALIRLLPTHSAYVEIKSEFYDALLLPLRRSLLGDTDQIRGTLGLDLLIAILKVPPETSSNASTCCQYLGEKGLQTIAEALEKMMNSAYQQLLASATTQDPNHAHELLSRATELLITLSSHAEGAAAIEKNPSVVAALLSLSSKHYISSYSPLAVATCLDCLTKLCLQDNLRPVVISAGGLLYLLDICVFCPVGPGLVEPPPPAVDADEGNNSATSDAPRLELNEASFLPLPPLAFAVRSSAVTLQACLVDSQGEECTAFVQVLRQLLTPSFVRILRLSPERFVLRLQSTDDICTSTLIWTTSMRRRLRDTLAMELTKVKTAARSNVWPRWNPDHFIAADSFRYQYPELADELIVHDVYINKFVSSDGVAFEDIDMSAFSQALLISIQSGENVLRILQQRGASDPAKERSIVVMRLALNKLVTTHPQHNLQVDPTPPTSIGMTSLIENESSDESDDDDDTSTAGSSVGGFRVQNNESALERSSTLDDLTV